MFSKVEKGVAQRVGRRVDAGDQEHLGDAEPLGIGEWFALNLGGEEEGQNVVAGLLLSPCEQCGEVLPDLVTSLDRRSRVDPLSVHGQCDPVGELLVVGSVDAEDLTENDRRHGEAVGHVRLDRAGAGGRQPASSVSGGRFEAGRPGGCEEW